MHWRLNNFNSVKEKEIQEKRIIEFGLKIGKKKRFLQKRLVQKNDCIKVYFCLKR